MAAPPVGGGAASAGATALGIAGVLAPIAGSIINNVSSARQQKRLLDWQERISNTAHQREAKDLEAAGLNRWLTLDAGGASTPSPTPYAIDTSGKDITR